MCRTLRLGVIYPHSDDREINTVINIFATVAVDRRFEPKQWISKPWLEFCLLQLWATLLDPRLRRILTRSSEMTQKLTPADQWRNDIFNLISVNSLHDARQKLRSAHTKQDFHSATSSRRVAERYAGRCKAPAVSPDDSAHPKPPHLLMPSCSDDEISMNHFYWRRHETIYSCSDLYQLEIL